MDSNNRCHLCNHALPAGQILLLKGMPKAAQYYPEIDEFAEDTGITLAIKQCSHCGLVQHGMQPVDYFKEVITAASLSEKARLSRLGQMQELVERFGLAGKKVVDIGCGEGAMLDVLEEVGMQATGVEASGKSVERGAALGRTMVQRYIGDRGAIAGGPFDAFICLNYLEHLPDPGRIIENISGNLAANAVGFVTVPNLEYLLKTKCLYEFVPDHISYFTTRTLTHAFEANGFDVLECRIINEENDIAATVKKREALNLFGRRGPMHLLINELQRLVATY
ncbi:MAG: C-methyltransferase, partial [Candidatus Wolfebacteria bacterium GW2011_GWE1_48_7]